MERPISYRLVGDYRLPKLAVHLVRAQYSSEIISVLCKHTGMSTKEAWQKVHRSGVLKDGLLSEQAFALRDGLKRAGADVTIKEDRSSDIPPGISGGVIPKGTLVRVIEPKGGPKTAQIRGYEPILSPDDLGELVPASVESVAEALFLYATSADELDYAYFEIETRGWLSSAESTQLDGLSTEALLEHLVTSGKVTLDDVEWVLDFVRYDIWH